MSDIENRKTKRTSPMMILLTTGVISALITSLVTLVVALNSSAALERIESVKFNQELHRYRYNRLMEFWGLVVDQAESATLDDLAKSSGSFEERMSGVRQLTKASDELRKLFMKSAPLFDKDLRQMIEKSSKSLESEVIRSHHLLRGEIGKKNSDPDLRKTLNAMVVFITTFQENLQQQLQRLLEPERRN